MLPRSLQSEVRGGDVFDSQPQRFEDGDFLGGGSRGRGFAKLADHMFRGESSFGNAHDDIAGFFERGSSGIDEEASSRDQRRVQFALRWDAGSDGDYVRAFCDPVALNHRRGRCGCCYYYIGCAHNRLGVGHGLGAGFGGELAGAVWVGAPGADFSELAHEGESFVVAAGLHSGAEDSEYARIFLGHVAGRDG
jgi:hypothetical protein